MNVFWSGVTASSLCSFGKSVSSSAVSFYLYGVRRCLTFSTEAPLKFGCWQSSNKCRGLWGVSNISIDDGIRRRSLDSFRQQHTLSLGGASGAAKLSGSSSAASSSSTTRRHSLRQLSSSDLCRFSDCSTAAPDALFFWGDREVSGTAKGGRRHSPPPPSSSSFTTSNGRNRKNHRQPLGSHGLALGLLFCGSPLLFTNWEEKNPKSELIFLTGSMVESLCHRLFETEYGQSVFLCLLFATTAMYLYQSLKMRRFVFDLKHKYGACHLTPLHPAFLSQAVHRNPLMKKHAGRDGTGGGKPTM